MRDLGAEVPFDPRTILKRSRSRPDSEEFHYFGLVNGLSQKLARGISSKVSTIQIMINIDGIPFVEEQSYIITSYISTDSELS